MSAYCAEKWKRPCFKELLAELQEISAHNAGAGPSGRHAQLFYSFILSFNTGLLSIWLLYSYILCVGNKCKFSGVCILMERNMLCQEMLWRKIESRVMEKMLLSYTGCQKSFSKWHWRKDLKTERVSQRKSVLGRGNNRGSTEETAWHVGRRPEGWSSLCRETALRLELQSGLIYSRVSQSCTGAG